MRFSVLLFVITVGLAAVVPSLGFNVKDKKTKTPQFETLMKRKAMKEKKQRQKRGGGPFGGGKRKRGPPSKIKNRDFRHPALQKVWTMAAVAGFDEAELKNLKRELSEHQSKIQSHRENRRSLFVEDPKHPELEAMKKESLGFRAEQDAFKKAVEDEAAENGKLKEIAFQAGLAKAADIRPTKQKRSQRTDGQKPKRKGKGKGRGGFPPKPFATKGKGRGKGRGGPRHALLDKRIAKLQKLLEGSDMPEEEKAEYIKGLQDFEAENEALKVERMALKKMHVASRSLFGAKGKGNGKGRGNNEGKEKPHPKKDMKARKMKHQREFAEGRKKIEEKHADLESNLQKLEHTFRVNNHKSL